MKGKKKKKAKKGKHDPESKKAIAPIISFVLLLGFAVALGTGVFLWQARQTERLGESVIRYASGVMDCQELNFNVRSRDGCTSIFVSNSGFFNIDGFVIRSFSSLGMGSEVEEAFVKAQGSDTLNVGLVDAEKVEVMPVVKLEGELVGCQDKVREVDCSGLDDIQVEACETADDQGTCDLLDGLGIVTCQECCDNLGKCCGC